MPESSELSDLLLRLSQLLADAREHQWSRSLGRLATDAQASRGTPQHREVATRRTPIRWTRRQ